MPLRPAISLMLLSLVIVGVSASVSHPDVFLVQEQAPAKKPSPTPTPPPNGPNPANPGGPSKTNTGAASSGDERERREEMMKKNADIQGTNRKVIEANETLIRTFKAGNEALSAASLASKGGNSDAAIQGYTAAIAQYDLGLAADAEQPALLINKAAALKARGVELFNAAVKSNVLQEASGTGRGPLQTAKDDFKAAAEAATKAVTLIKAYPVPTDPAEVQRYNAYKYAALVTNAEAMKLFVSKADPKQADAGVAAFKEYLAVETDPAKRAKAQLDLAQMLLDSGAPDRALAEFQAALAIQPDSPEANLGAGLALYATGDKTKFQEAANYLQRFLDVTPDSQPMKDDAKSILMELKNSEKVTPEKRTTKPPQPIRP